MNENELNQESNENIDAIEENVSETPQADALLDSLTEQSEQPEGLQAQTEPPAVHRDERGRFAPKGSDEQAAEAVANPADAPPQDPLLPVDDPELAEALDGVTSERGQQRIRKVFESLKERDSQVAGIRDLIGQHFTNDEFVGVLEYSRLAKSSNPADLQVALSLLDQQRADLAKRLGTDVPGVDVLSDFPDLQQQVAQGAMHRQHAVEMAQLRRQQGQIHQQQQQYQQQYQQQQQIQQDIQAGQQQLQQYLISKQQDPDFAYKQQVIIERFRDPAMVQQFASTYQPHQWAAAVDMMYSSIQAPARQPSFQPMRSTPKQTSHASRFDAQDPVSGIMSVMDRMGL